MLNQVAITDFPQDMQEQIERLTKDRHEILTCRIDGPYFRCYLKTKYTVCILEKRHNSPIEMIFLDQRDLGILVDAIGIER